MSVVTMSPATTILEDAPARVRLEVTDKQGADQKALIWAFRSRNYSSAATAKAAYAATELAPLGGATKGTVTGAASGTAVNNTALPSMWTPVVGTNLGGSTYLTHEGNYRVYARLRSPDGTAVAARLLYDVGDLAYPTENPEWRLPGGSAWYVADLGEVRLQPAPVGTHRWQGQIQAKGTEGGEDINVDRVWFVNTDEGAGALVAPPVNPGLGATPFVALDGFNHSAGTLTGKVLTTGGTWISPSGTITDFSINTTDHRIQRTTLGNIRTVQPGTATYSTVGVALDLQASAMPSSLWRSTIIVRNSSGGLKSVKALVDVEPSGTSVSVWKTDSEGEPERIAKVPVQAFGSTWRKLILTIVGDVWSVYFNAPGANPTRIASGWDTAIAGFPAGTIFFSDFCSSTSAVTRSYDNFAAWVPTADAVVFASQKAQISTKGMYRLDSGGSAYGPVSRVTGDLPRLPAGNIEGRTAELFVKASPGDLGDVPDFAIGDLSVKVYSRRSWLTFPGTI